MARRKNLGNRPVTRRAAIWLDGPVPSGYWEHRENRLLYMRWLGQQLGFRKHEDWYQITTADFRRNHGAALLAMYWDSSAVCAVMDCFPDDDWKEWLFAIAPREFWHDPTNHRRYMKWLGEQLGIRRPADWYHVTNQDFQQHKGGALLLHYDSVVSRAIMSYRPDYDWKEWMFSTTPKRFWHERRNRRRYLQWLGDKLGFQNRQDWYALTTEDFNANYGSHCLNFYDGSTIAALRDCFPRSTWHEWMLVRVPVGFWNSLENRQRYVRWLGKKLKVSRSKDWFQVKRRDFLDNFGGGLLARYSSHFDLLRECIPELECDRVPEQR